MSVGADFGDPPSGLMGIVPFEWPRGSLYAKQNPRSLKTGGGGQGYEVDFLVQLGGDIIPVEVKAAEHTQAKPLTAYRKRNQPAYAIKLSGKNFGMEDGLRSVPLYAVFCI